MANESNVEEVNIPLRHEDESDGTLTAQLRQLPVNMMEELIKRMRSSVVLKMLFIVITLVVIVNVSVNLKDIITSNRNNSALIKPESWNMKDSQLDVTNITNCETQYDLGYNIRISYCKNGLLGQSIDLRYFSYGKSTIRGIAIPKFILPRLTAILNSVK